MTDKENTKEVGEKDFLKSLDALETLAKGEIVTQETDELEKAAPSVEGEELEKADPVVEEPAEDLEKADPADDDDDLEKGEPDNDDDDDGDDDGVDKSFAETATEESENIEKAVEVSDFLSDLVDQVGFALDRIEKSVKERLAEMEKSIESVKVFNSKLAKSLKMSFEAMDGGIEDLRKSFDTIADAPAHGRKSVTTLEKSFGENGETKAPKKADVLNAMQMALEKSVEGITSMDIVRYEATGDMPPHVAKVLGLG